jgi:EAL domain-containing protein (putative c-di-GMP-specific phosphodiesterase class I)
LSAGGALERGATPLFVSVNLSARQFTQSDLVDDVAQTLVRSALEADALELEITESVLMDQSEAGVRALRDLRGIGVRLVLDDFGTGYSSLNYLRKFPFQKIKIDQSFIAGLGEERDAQAIIGAVAGLGASLDKTVVAEGIETEEQLKQVKMHGCHEGQGHLFGEPMPADIIQARLEASTSVAQLVA